MTKPTILTPQTIAEGQAFLTQADPTMAKLIATNRPLKLHKQETPFETLAISIINQQLSQKAADVIEGRVRGLAPLTAAGIAATSPDSLRAAGLSWSKIKYLNNLAEAEQDGILNRRTLSQWDNDKIISHLTGIKGVGKWTAEMFLMFCMRRADVVSMGDAGLRRGARMFYGKRFRQVVDDGVLLDKVAKRWQPWRTIGCWHLWRALD